MAFTGKPDETSASREAKRWLFGGKMRIYLASRYSRHLELQKIARALIAEGHVITSRWIWGDHKLDESGLSVEALRFERGRFADEDLADLMEADMIISFTEKPRSSNSRGGRHVEFGVALASKKRCLVVGPRENVFHCLPNVEVYETMNDANQSLNHDTPSGAG